MIILFFICSQPFLVTSLAKVFNRRAAIFSPFLVFISPQLSSAVGDKPKSSIMLDLEYYGKNFVKEEKSSDSRINGLLGPFSPPLTPLTKVCDTYPILVGILPQICNDVFVSTLTSFTKQTESEVVALINTTINNEKIRMKSFPCVTTPLGNLNDGAFFDFNAYCLFTAASTLLPTSDDRSIFLIQLGRNLLNSVEQTNQIKAPPRTNNLSKSQTYIDEILKFLLKSHFMSSYTIQTFDEFDDEDLAKGNEVEVTISVKDPITITSAMARTGENSRFSPDFIGLLVQAAFSRILPHEIVFDKYFMDSIYRSNPTEYLADEQLEMFTIR